MEPLAMPSLHPIVCEQEAQPPHEQDAIIDDCTPEQYLTYYLKAHEPSPMCLLPLRSGLLVQVWYTPHRQHKRYIDQGISRGAAMPRMCCLVLLIKDCVVAVADSFAIKGEH